MDVTPASETFYMTGFIYVWQCVWLGYGASSICRTVQGCPLYTTFPVLPPILYVVFSFSLACNISWLLIWDREYMEVALVFINLMTCTLYICLVVSLRRLNECGYHMARNHMTREIWLIRVFVHNGIAMFASWGTVASIFNFAVVLTYRTGAKKTVGSIVSLTIFTMELLAWWVFDICIFDRLFRYLYSPYLVVLISLSGILVKNWDASSSSAIYTASLLALTALLTLTKTVVMVYRHKKYPIFPTKQYDENSRESCSYERAAFIDMPPGNVMV
jgi:hypothetical protein